MIEILKEKYLDQVSINKNLSNLSWFNIGGPADIFFKPKNIEQLSSFIKSIKNEYKKINIIGAGSNTLIRDGGVEGVTIKLSSNFSYTKLLDNNIIEAGAGTFDRIVSDFAALNKISGLEFLSCIPGSIGGAIIMNSGCYGTEVCNILTSIKVMDLNGNIKDIKNNEIKFSYRSCDLPDDLIILSAKFKGKPSTYEKIKKKQRELIEKKKNSQPSQVKTCGSTFKNPKNIKAWELIKNSKCESMFTGKVIISEKHYNFFVNSAKATSFDIEELIKKIKKRVRDKTGVNLELEIKIIGRDK